MINFQFKNQGFTLIEVLASIGIFAVIIVAVGTFQANVFSYQRTASGSFQTVQDAQIILRNISHDLRMTSPGSDGSYPLQTVGTSSLMFFADLNSDGLKERIRYSFIGSKLYKAVMIPTGSPLGYTGTESTSSILTDVVNSTSTPIFSYYSGSYTGSTTGVLSQPVSPNTVRLIQISLTLDVNPNQAPLSRTYSSQVVLRNLKDNL